MSLTHPPVQTQATAERTDGRSPATVVMSPGGAEGKAAIRRVLQPIAAGLIALLLFVGTFASAIHKPQPHDVPVGIVAPPSVLARVQSALNARAHGAFALHTYASATQARAAIDAHAIDGALVMTPPAPHLYLAGGAGMSDTELISTVFSEVAKAGGQRLVVQDLKPLPAYDPHGLTPFFLIVGLLISGILFSVILFVRARDLSLRAHLGAMVLFALLAGPLGALTVDVAAGGWMPRFWEAAIVCSTLSLSVALTTMALSRLLGFLGIALAAYMLIPLSASTAGGPVNYEFLPDVLRGVSQVLPAGAALTALRNTLYFGGNSLSDEVMVLLAWIAVALLVLAATALAHREGAPERALG